jgi:hypothetical protein
VTSLIGEVLKVLPSQVSAIIDPSPDGTATTIKELVHIY